MFRLGSICVIAAIACLPWSSAECVEDPCAQALQARSTKGSRFCAAYTGSATTTTIPSYLSDCSGSSDRISSACSCAFPASTAGAWIATTRTITSNAPKSTITKTMSVTLRRTLTLTSVQTANTTTLTVTSTLSQPTITISSTLAAQPTTEKITQTITSTANPSTSTVTATVTLTSSASTSISTVTATVTLTSSVSTSISTTTATLTVTSTPSPFTITVTSTVSTGSGCTSSTPKATARTQVVQYDMNQNLITDAEAPDGATIQFYNATDPAAVADSHLGYGYGLFSEQMPRNVARSTNGNSLGYVSLAANFNPYLANTPYLCEIWAKGDSTSPPGRLTGSVSDQSGSAVYTSNSVQLGASYAYASIKWTSGGTLSGQFLLQWTFYTAPLSSSELSSVTRRLQFEGITCYNT